MQHLLTPEGDTPKKKCEDCPCALTVDEAQFYKLQSDIEALKLRVEEVDKETYQIDQESQTYKDIEKIEEATQKVLESKFEGFVNDPKTLTDANIATCNSLLNLLDRFRHIKIQFEAMRHIKLNVYGR